MILFLFRGVQRGYFSFQGERGEIMKADELLISVKELPWRKPISLVGYDSMSDSAICHQPRIAPDDMGASQHQPPVTT
jgi:hypothetical protein